MRFEARDDAWAVAAVQLCSTADSEGNLRRAVALTREALVCGARLVALPENFGFLGDDEGLQRHAQSVTDGPFVTPMRALAREFNAFVLLGSVPEKSATAKRIHNTSVLIDGRGEVVATYRKIHLFDVDLTDGTRLTESARVSPGSLAVVAPVGPFTLGLSICYDLRFPELYRSLVSRGADLLAVPAAFTLHTGKDHWDLLVRARAVENQCFVIAPAQVGHHGGGRSSWGKSLVVDPWGTPLAVAPERECFIIARLERRALEEVRSRLPALRHRAWRALD